MRTAVCAAVAALCAWIGSAAAEPFDCRRPENADRTVCTDKPLAKLLRAADAAANRLASRADPLTALLLRRDQRWFRQAMTDGDYSGEADGDEKPGRALEVVRRRLAVLDRVRVGAVDGVAGEWVNGLGTARLTVLASDRVKVEAVTTVPADEDRPVRCALAGELILRPDGWYAGLIAGTPDPDGARTGAGAGDDDDDKGARRKTPTTAGDNSLRLRLQGNTLRIVRTEDVDDRLCSGPDMVTGSYFPVAAGAPGAADAPAGSAGASARRVNPSFDCATAKNTDEEEICADPELAGNDAELSRVYAAALRRLDAATGALLRADQRAWAKENVTVVDTWLNPYWDKTYGRYLQPGGMRDELVTRQKERLSMLARLDDGRRGIAGLWVAHNAIVSIAPARDKPGVLTLLVRKWETGDHKSHCDVDADGRLVNGAFKADGDDDLPVLRREGATLIVADKAAAKDDDKRPSYCTRMDSAAARLFPVKPETDVGDLELPRIR